MNKITPFLWFDNQAVAAAKFYCSIFKDSRIKTSLTYDENDTRTGQARGSVMVVEFELNGQSFIALNGGPRFKFNESVSFVIDCATQDEVDYYWEALTKEGEESMCGWLKDKYGLWWQVVPRKLNELIAGKDQLKAKAAMDAMLRMRKIEIQVLQDAYDNA